APGRLQLSRPPACTRSATVPAGLRRPSAVRQACGRVLLGLPPALWQSAPRLRYRQPLGARALRQPRGPWRVPQPRHEPRPAFPRLPEPERAELPAPLASLDRRLARLLAERTGLA